MSVATEFPPDVCIPAAARPRSLRVVPAASGESSAAAEFSAGAHAFRPAAPAAAALGAGVVDLDRWRHHIVGAQAEGRRRIASGLRTRPESSAGPSAASSAGSSAAPVRLTRRGLTVLAAVAALAAVAVLVIAWLSAPGSAGSAGSGAAGSQAAGSSAIVTVHSGDSLWSIATQVAPNRDPRAEVAQLITLNHLTGDTVSPGQQLRLR